MSKLIQGIKKVNQLGGTRSAEKEIIFELSPEVDKGIIETTKAANRILVKKYNANTQNEWYELSGAAKLVENDFYIEFDNVEALNNSQKSSYDFMAYMESLLEDGIKVYYCDSHAYTIDDNYYDNVKATLNKEMEDILQQVTVKMPPKTKYSTVFHGGWYATPDNISISFILDTKSAALVRNIERILMTKTSVQESIDIDDKKYFDFKVQLGKNTSTGDSYYNIFADTSLPEVSKKINSLLKTNEPDAMHFPTKQEAADYIVDTLIDNIYNDVKESNKYAGFVIVDGEKNNLGKIDF